MSSYAGNPQTDSGVGGAGPNPLGEDWSQYYLPQLMGLPAPPTDPGLHLDAQYYAQEAQNRQAQEGLYNAAIAKLGYTGANGAFIPGSILQGAQLKEAQDEAQRQQAILQNTQNAQQQGILFSGKRAEMQAQAEQPYVGDIAQTELGLPVDMTAALNDARGSITGYSTQNDLDLAAAAQRYAAAQQQQPTTPTAPTPPPSNVTPTPPPTTSGPETPGGQPQGPGSIYLLPYQYSGTKQALGGMLMAQGGEVDQPTQAIIGEKGPEAVVPMSGLHPEEQNMVHGLIAAARARMGGGSPPTSGGIHWFGPGGSGVWNPPTRPVDPIHLPEQPLGGLPTDMFPPQVLPPGLSPGHVSPETWMMHHPGVMSGHVGTGYVPHWARAAVNARLHPPEHVIHGFGPGGPVTWPPVQPIGLPPIGIPNPGISPQ